MGNVRIGTQGAGIAAICVAVSAAVLFVVLSVRQGVDWDLASLVESIGGDLFTITARSGTFDSESLDRISQLPFVREVGGSTAYSQFYSPAETLMLYVVGVTHNYFQLLNLALRVGHTFGAATEEYVAVLGSKVASALFPEGDPLDGEFSYRGHSFKVVGVLEPFPTTRGAGSSWGFAQQIDNPDHLVFVPYRTHALMVSLPVAGLDDMGKLGFLWGRARDGCLRQAIRQVNELFDGMEEVQVRPLAAQYEGLFYTRRRISDALAAIALLVLLISSTNVASVSATALLDRSKEIGIRRALGACRSHIGRMLLREATFLMLSSGAVGAILGALLLHPIALALGTSLRIGMYHLVFLGALATSGLLAGTLPAVLGARMDPARAISQRSITSRSLGGVSLNRLFSGVAVAAGIAVTVIIVALGDTSIRYLRLRWLSPEPGTLRVRPGMEGFRQPVDLSYDDFLALASLESIDSAVWMASSRSAAVASAHGASEAVLVEITAGASRIGIGIVDSGRMLSDEELTLAHPSVVLGSGISQRLFPDGNAIGAQVDLPQLQARVVGVLASRPGLPPYDYVDINDAVFVPRGVMDLHTSPGRSWIWLKPTADTSADDLASIVVALLAERHPGRGLVEVSEPAAEMNELVAVQRSVSVAQLALAALGLIVATTGMGSTVWLSVVVRKREIGIRKAVGARGVRIFLQFVLEALGTTIVASGVGMGAGVIGMWFLNRNAEIRVILSPNWLFLTLGAACVVALASSAGPACYASRCEAASAIRRGDG